MNQLRRDLIEKLEKERLAKRPILQKASENSVQYPIQELDYHANVMNSKAREFYEKHGAHVNQEAFEKGLGDTEAEVMRCRYCIRHEMNICPKQAKARGEKVKPTPLVLKIGKIKMTAYFDCKRCEMSLLSFTVKF